MSEHHPPDADATTPLGLFAGYGIEVEYIIADRKTLDVLPIAHTVLQSMGANTDGVVEAGPVAWSNELAAHVIELKTNGPVSDLDGTAEAFSAAVRAMNERLAQRGACLLPSGMHPWMDPSREFELYPVDDEGYYNAFNRIFDCRGHGWSNLQSMHINLPFKNDEEFALLHAAIRMLLPIMPALSASSPIVEGVVQSALGKRLFVYRDNAARVPSVSGKVVPEHVESRGDYEQVVLNPIYEELRPHDPEGILRYEWVNARGCIARFDRMALEIRVLDAQESPRADLAVARAICEVLRSQCAAGHLLTASRNWSTLRLAELLWQVAAAADQCLIEDADYLALWGITSKSISAGQLWRHLIDQCSVEGSSLDDARWLTEHGCLARRLLANVGAEPSRATLHRTYSQLSGCLQDNTWFE